VDRVDQSIVADTLCADRFRIRMRQLLRP
jgi:hypothetical protein